MCSERTSNLNLDDIISNLSASHPGQHTLITHLATLLSTTAPPFIHIHTPVAPQRTTALVIATLRATHTRYAHLHGVECVTPRLVFDRVLGALAGWETRWDEGVGCTPFGGDMYNTDFGAFLEGLRAVAGPRAGKDKDDNAGAGMVIVLERAESLRVKELIVPLARLAELSEEPVTTLFISQVSWFDIRPPFGAVPDPFLIDVPILSQQDTISTLISFFPSRSTNCPSISAYTPHMKPLYAQYIAALCSVCAPFLVDVQELGYVAAACWPVFVAPVLAEWNAEGAERDGGETVSGQYDIREHDQDERMTQDEDKPMEQSQDEPMAHHQDEPLEYAQHTPPNLTQLSPSIPTSTQSLSPFTLPIEETRIRLVRYFTPFFSRALEALYPRTQHARQWAIENAPPVDLKLSELLGGGGRARGQDAVNRQWKPEGRGPLTTLAKYVLVASFLASNNPAKTDVRMVGRAPDERGKKRRRGGPRKARGGGMAKVSQRLLGPAAFPLDRLLAILGSLMEEHDADVPSLPSMPSADDNDEIDYGREKDTEMAVRRIQVSATISELVAMRLLHRTTPGDRLDGPPAFKCGISQARAFELARELWAGSLADFMWETG